MFGPWHMRQKQCFNRCFLWKPVIIQVIFPWLFVYVFMSLWSLSSQHSKLSKLVCYQCVSWRRLPHCCCFTLQRKCGKTCSSCAWSMQASGTITKFLLHYVPTLHTTALWRQPGPLNFCVCVYVIQQNEDWWSDTEEKRLSCFSRLMLV